MAKISFFQQVVVKDEQKINEIKHAIENDIHAYKTISPTIIDFEKQKEDIKTWLSLFKNMFD